MGANQQISNSGCNLFAFCLYHLHLSSWKEESHQQHLKLDVFQLLYLLSQPLLASDSAVTSAISANRPQILHVSPAILPLHLLLSAHPKARQTAVAEADTDSHGMRIFQEVLLQE